LQNFLAIEEPIRDGGQITGQVASSTLFCTLNSSFYTSNPYIFVAGFMSVGATFGAW
jgi:hypothetical protein